MPISPPPVPPTRVEFLTPEPLWHAQWDFWVSVGTLIVSYDLPFKDAEPSWQDVKDALTVAVTKAPKGTVIAGIFGMKVLDNSQATRA